ncbi:hypothetical protein C8R45DRAFT_991166, partial [Mycena sanguinolenta]
DYSFMSVCEDLWRQETRDFQFPRAVSQVSLDTLRILYAFRVTATAPYGWNTLFRIRCLLGLSWDELRAAICPLREILGRDITQLTNHRTWIVDETVLATLDTSSVLAELAKSSLCHIRTMIAGQINGTVFDEIVPTWGFFVRACPPSPELLNDLSEFAGASDRKISDWASTEDLYNVVQWLKTFRPIPVELVNRFEDKLEVSPWPDAWNSKDSLEREWMVWWEKCQEYGKRLTILEPYGRFR